MRPSVKLIGAAIVLVAVAFAAGWGMSRWVKSPADAIAETRPPESTLLTAAVTKQSVVKTQPFDATVEHAFVTAITPSSSADSTRVVITRVPVQRGSTVANATTLVEVNGRPVIALTGRIPSYRTLQTGDSGPDVLQLQQALRSAGYATGSDKDTTFGAGTTDAVRALYKAVGYAPLAATTDPTTTGSSPASRQGGASSSIGAATAPTGVQVPPNEIVFVPALPATVTTANLTIGGDASSARLELSSGPLVARGSVQTPDPGLKVGITTDLLTDSGERLAGTLGSIDQPATSQGSGADTFTNGPTNAPDSVVATITPDQPLDDALLGHSIRVIARVATSPSEELTVPLSALQANPDGTTRVMVSANAAQQAVPVTIGFTGDGLAQVAPGPGSTLSVGDLVVVGQGTPASLPSSDATTDPTAPVATP